MLKDVENIREVHTKLTLYREDTTSKCHIDLDTVALCQFWHFVPNN
jgi:hypothetical protein